MKKLEWERVEGIHSAINKFVVYEKFAEMNNKYDVQNFSKILDEFTEDSELETICENLGINKVKPQPRFEFASYEAKKFDIAKLSMAQLSPPKEKMS